MKLVLKLDVTPAELAQSTEAWRKSGLKRLDDLVIQLLKARAEEVAESTAKT